MDRQQKKENKAEESVLKTLLKKSAKLAEQFRTKLSVGYSREKAASDLLCFGIAFLLSRGEWLFGAYPFGVALMCASEQRLWLIYAGSLAGALFTKGSSPFLFISVYSLILALRLRGSANKSPAAKPNTSVLTVTLAAAASLIPGVYGCINEGFTLHSLFALLFYLAACPLFAFLYSGLYKGLALRRIYKKAAWAALLFSIVFASSSISVFGFSPAPAVASFLCLLCAQNEDYLTCGVLGLILGIACGKEYALVFCLTGLVSSAFFKYSKKLAPWLGVLSGFAVSFFSRGTSAFYYVLPDLVAGLLLFLPAQMYLSKRKNSKKTASAQAARGKSRDADLPERLENLGGKIEKLSKKLRTPSETGVARLCENTLKAVCSGCPNDCFSSAEQRKKLAGALRANGNVTPAAPPISALPFCKKTKLLCDELNTAYADHLRRLEESDRVQSYASCCRCLSGTIRDRARAEQEAEQTNEEESAKLRSALDKLSFDFAGAAVCGKRRLSCRITGVDPDEMRRYSDQLQKILEESVGRRVSLPLLTETGQTGSLSFCTLPALRAQCGSSCENKNGERSCGDTSAHFVFDNYLYAMICDGMGSGRDAALSSRVCCRFIKDLTEMGASFETLLPALNDFLLSIGCEIPSTVDLMRADLYTGRCDFIKCGACASLVLRDGNTFKVSCASIPIGASREAKYEMITVRLKAGDRVILVSDGVCEEFETAPWLRALLDGQLGEDPQTLAKSILRSSSGNGVNDDKTVLVAQLFPDGA